MKRRPKRVAETVLREISEFFARGGVKDPNIGFVTFTEVDISPDLRQAKVYYAVHGDAQDLADTQSALDRASGFVRRHVGQSLHLKVTPQLLFCYDSSIDYAEHIDKLLQQVKGDETELAAGDASPQIEGHGDQAGELGDGR